MVKVAAIKGITYNQAKADIDNVIAPPYDVISDEGQRELYDASPYNIVRLILGTINETDTEENNRYTRAAEFFNKWLQENVLEKSQKPCIYYYVQNYTTPKGKEISRKGFIASNRIETFDTKKVLPHEYTMGGPKADRLKLMKACKANFSQIFMVYSDPERKIDQAFKLPDKPLVDVVDGQGVRNILYAIDDESVIKAVCDLMEDKTLLIADGHHRYETSIAYRDYLRSQNPNYTGEEPFNYVMSYFTNLDDENLLVFPTHRIIERAVDTKQLLEDIGRYFDNKEYIFTQSDKEKVKEEFVQDIDKALQVDVAFGLCLKGENKYILFSLREKDAINKILDKKEVPDVLKKLDLSVLHKVIISDFLGFSDEDQMKQNGIKYIKQEAEAFEALESGEAELIFVMGTPSIQDIKDVSQDGYRMPQKSTYFYPKLLSGLVINPLI